MLVVYLPLTFAFTIFLGIFIASFSHPSAKFQGLIWRLCRESGGSKRHIWDMSRRQNWLFTLNTVKREFSTSWIEMYVAQCGTIFQGLSG